MKKVSIIFLSVLIFSCCNWKNTTTMITPQPIMFTAYSQDSHEITVDWSYSKADTSSKIIIDLFENEELIDTQTELVTNKQIVFKSLDKDSWYTLKAYTDKSKLNPLIIKAKTIYRDIDYINLDWHTDKKCKVSWHYREVLKNDRVKVEVSVLNPVTKNYELIKTRYFYLKDEVGEIDNLDPQTSYELIVSHTEGDHNHKWYFKTKVAETR